VAQFYEQRLEEGNPSTDLILAYHWSRAADHSMAHPDYVLVEKAAQYLHRSARAAINECAFREGIEQLHHACRILDRVPIQQSTAFRKLELLSEIAPHTLLLYGPGSPEAMAAYNGLMMVVCENGGLDDRAVKVLAGICINLYGRQQFETGWKMARRIYKAGLKNKSHFQLEVALSCMVEPLYVAGEFEDMLLAFDRLFEAYHKKKQAGKPQLVVNGVVHCVVSMAYWPSVLLITGQVERARSKVHQVIEMAHETKHPPTLCTVLCTLCNEYFPFTGEVDVCDERAEHASGISEQYDLVHCRHLAHRARAWCKDISEHFEMLRAGEHGQDVRKHLAQNASTRDGTHKSRHLGCLAEFLGKFDSSGQPTSEHRVFEINGGRFANLLGLQVLAARREWRKVKERVATTLSACNASMHSGFYSEYLRLQVAARIALDSSGREPAIVDRSDSGLSDRSVSTGPAEWASTGAEGGGRVGTVEETDGTSDRMQGGGAEDSQTYHNQTVHYQFKECVSHSLSRGYVYLALLAAVDWLCFEIDEAAKFVGDKDKLAAQIDGDSTAPPSSASPPVSAALLEVVAVTRLVLDKIHGGKSLLPVKLAENLVRRYEALADSASSESESEVKMELSLKIKPHRRSKTRTLLADYLQDAHLDTSEQQQQEQHPKKRNQDEQHSSEPMSAAANGQQTSTKQTVRYAAPAGRHDAAGDVGGRRGEGRGGEGGEREEQREATQGSCHVGEVRSSQASEIAKPSADSARLERMEQADGTVRRPLAVKAATKALGSTRLDGTKGDETKREIRRYSQGLGGGGENVRQGSSKNVLLAAGEEAASNQVLPEVWAGMQVTQSEDKRACT
jgi:hypothetical protein